VLYYALCSYPSMTLQEAGLRAFWSVNGPRILQFGYEDEEDPKVMEAYERVGSLVCQFSCVLFTAVFSSICLFRAVSDSLHFTAGSWQWDIKMMVHLCMIQIKLASNWLSLSAARGKNIVPVKFILHWTRTIFGDVAC
jgi:hypothetical protein